jgi:hypothetical protein
MWALLCAWPLGSRGSAQATVQAAAPDAAAAVLSEAKTALERAQFAAAEKLLTELLAQSSLAARERNDALELFAIVQIAERKDAKARETLRALLQRDPDHHRRVLDPGPAVDAAFARAKQEPREALQVPLQFSLSNDAGERPVLRIELGEGADAVESVHAFIPEQGDEPGAHLVGIPGADRALRMALPAAPREHARLGLYLQASAPSGAVLGGVGDASAPVYVPLRRVAPPADACTVASKPLRREWWVWTTLGLVVSGIVIASAVSAN